MKNARKVTVLAVSLLTLVPALAIGQDFVPSPQPGSPEAVTPPNYPSSPAEPYAPQPYAPPNYAQTSDPNAPLPAAAPQQQVYTQQQLEQLVAPIALYPDQLLTQALMASTYPLEIVEAQRWYSNPQNAALKGPELQAALDQLPWDPSVKSLIATPQVLSMMDNNLQWTEQLGDAFLASQGGVMDSVQALRQKAQAAGNLASTPQQTVVQQQGAIVIQPTNPQVVYVPYYNPTIVYGAWPWAAYPPYYFPPPPGYVDYTVGLLGFGVGIAVVDWLWGWDHWDWHRHSIFIDEHRFAGLNRGYAPHFAGGAWAHDPEHRHGVPYRNAGVRQQFGGAATQARQNYRGYFNAPQNRANNMQRVASPGGERAGTSFASQSRSQASEMRGAALTTQSRVESPVSQARSMQPQTSHAAASHSAPMFESFSRGSDVRAQSQRGSYSRASMGSAAAHTATTPPAHASAGGGGHAVGGHDENRR